MYKISKTKYENILNLLNGKKEEITFAYSVIEGKQSGEIYVDDLHRPKSCLVAKSCGKYLVAGNEDNSEFNNLLVEYLTNKTNHNLFYDLYATSPKWIEVLNNMITNKVVKLGRNIYAYHNTDLKSLSAVTNQLPESFELRRMDADLFNQYAAQIDPSYKFLYNSANHFLEVGFGFCILHNNELVSTCNSFYISNNYAEIDIQTKEAYRGRGFASITASAFIDHCISNNLVPVWDADAGNNSSNALVVKLGFSKIQNMNILWWHENEKQIENYLKKYNYTT